MFDTTKRYFVFGWNDNDSWRDESDLEVGFMVTGLHLRRNGRSVAAILRDWDSIICELELVTLSHDFEHIGIFEVDDFRKHRDEFQVWIDDSTDLQYCLFKPRTKCVRLVKEIDISDLKSFSEWLDVFDIMSIKSLDDEDKHSKKEAKTKVIKKALSFDESLERSRAQCTLAIIVVAIIQIIYTHFTS